MSIDQAGPPPVISWRRDVAFALAYTFALFLIFIVAFVGRDRSGDDVKTMLTVLSIGVGAIGVLWGFWTLRLRLMAHRFPTISVIALAWVIFAGAYTIYHVLS